MDKNALIGPSDLEEDDVVTSKGPVRVRALSRTEAMAVQKAKSTERREQVMVALGMLDPQLTEAEVFTWQQNSVAGDLQKVSVRIAELSGLVEESDKEAMATFRDEPDD